MKTLFIDRDGTIIKEPRDKQIDSLEKLEFLPNTISSLQKFKEKGFKLIMVSNQDGLGTKNYPKESFELVQNKILKTLQNEGITFDKIFICKHFSKDNCNCRKPKLGLIKSYLLKNEIDKVNSFVIGDRDTDMIFAKNIGIQGVKISSKFGWQNIVNQITSRKSSIIRKTNETNIEIAINLDGTGNNEISTGIKFFDHMLMQIAKHSGIDIKLNMTGDLEVDEHHAIEDTGIALGEVIKNALGNKKGINRYGFLLPMDESLAQVAIDIGGRQYFVFKGEFKREYVGDMPTELVKHFFKSFSDGFKCNLNMKINGENEHHKIEALFKALGRCLKESIKQNQYSNEIPSSKGVI